MHCFEVWEGYVRRAAKPWSIRLCCEWGDSPSLASLSLLSTISIHHSSELLFPCKVQIMTFPWIKISYLCLLNNTQVLQWVIRRLSPPACALPPSLLALQSLLPWPPLNTLLCVHRILSAWKALLHPRPHMLDELLRLNSNMTFSMAIPPTLARRSPSLSTSPQHLHTVNQLLSSLRSIAFCFMIPSVLVECELNNDNVVR